MINTKFTRAYQLYIRKSTYFYSGPPHFCKHKPTFFVTNFKQGCHWPWKNDL